MNDSPSKADVERRVTALVRDRLPTSWTITDSLPPVKGSLRPDLAIAIKAPDGRLTRLMIEVKQVIERRDVAGIRERAGRMTAGSGSVPVVAARYLSANVREALAESGLSFVDATGNMRIAVESPAVYISDRGDDRDPWLKGRPPGTLKGAPAARVARTLLDHRRHWRVRDLITASGASSGATYRVLNYLQREDLVVKDGHQYTVSDWERLLREWSADAAFQTTTRMMTFIEPRGVEHFLNKLSQESPFQVAVTGSIAAKEWATYAPAKAVYAYVSSIEQSSLQWGLRPNAVAPNIILLEPQTNGDVPFVNTLSSANGYPVAAPAQVAADLLNGPGREPAEGEYLIEWMKAHEMQWRRD